MSRMQSSVGSLEHTPAGVSVQGSGGDDGGGVNSGGGVNGGGGAAGDGGGEAGGGHRQVTS